MGQSAQIADDTWQGGGHDVLVQSGQQKRQHQSGKYQPEPLGFASTHGQGVDRRHRDRIA
jgi:hypothetical protein